MAPAHEAFEAKFRREVDPDGTLPRPSVNVGLGTR